MDVFPLCFRLAGGLFSNVSFVFSLVSDPLAHCIPTPGPRSSVDLVPGWFAMGPGSNQRKKKREGGEGEKRRTTEYCPAKSIQRKACETLTVGIGRILRLDPAHLQLICHPHFYLLQFLSTNLQQTNLPNKIIIWATLWLNGTPLCG